ncbi:hypothetical protein B566_EDAN000892 [Ephemera danica]|nr:hypothetical protein B566_EDAN000892 [Ephemera danica]
MLSNFFYSVSGQRIPNWPRIYLYSASKHAVMVLTEGLRRELRDLKTKIKITGISPGFVRTRIQEAAGVPKEQIEQFYESLGTYLMPRDIAEALLYSLATPPHVQVHEITIISTAAPGRVALVTGAGSGIGEAIACILFENGMKVVAADVDLSRVEVSQRIPNWPRIYLYSASKHAVMVLTEGLRRELRDLKTKIKITGISPGFVRTRIQEAAGVPKEQIEQFYESLGTYLMPRDIAEALLYSLATPPHVQVHEITIISTAAPGS